MTDLPENNDATPTAAAKKQSSNRFTWLAVAAGVILAKGKIIFALLFKSAIIAPFFTFFLSLATYGLWLGWAAGAGLVVHLLVHEFGHYVAARKQGVRASLPKFNPLFGAWVSHDDPHHDLKTAIIALGGPCAGLVLSFICLGVWAFTGMVSHFWLWMAAIGLLLNLSNLIPVRPLDGGHVLEKFWPSYMPYTLAAVAFVAAASGNSQLNGLLVLIMWTNGMPSPVFWYAFAAGCIVHVIMGGSLWYLVLAGACVAFVALPLERWVRTFFRRLFGLRPQPQAPLVQKPAEPAAVEAAPVEPASVPLSTADRWFVGSWYVAMIGVGVPVMYWLYTLHALSVPK